MYAILENDSVIGTVCVEKAGLYYRFNCVCSPRKPGKCHICLRADGKILDLGLCVPEQDHFALRTSIPVKYIPTGKLEFYLVDLAANDHIIPVSDHQPFEKLQMLKTARLVRQSGQLLIHLYTAPDR